MAPLSRITLLLALLCALAGCSKPAVYLDHEWSLYYAQNTCYLYLPKGDRDPELEPCLAHRVAALQRFEGELLPALAAQPDCTGIVVGNLKDLQPQPTKGFWRLLISLDDTAGTLEPWDLMSPRSPPKIHHGRGGVREIAQEVCGIAGDRAPAGK